MDIIFEGLLIASLVAGITAIYASGLWLTRRAPANARLAHPARMRFELARVERMSAAAAPAPRPLPAGLTLYDLEISGNCYKARLLMGLLGQEHRLVPVDFVAGGHRSPAMLALNPLGELPVLTDGDVVLRDSGAILVYLARREDRLDWLPIDPAGLAAVQQWLSFAVNEIARGPGDAWRAVRFGDGLDLDLARQRAARVLDLLDQHLANRDWLVLGRPTIADIACFPDVALGQEGGAPADGHANVMAWIGRIKALPGWVPMSAI